MPKNKIQKMFLVITFSLLVISSGFAEGICQCAQQPFLKEKILQVEQKGVLKLRDNGYLYLDVSDDFIVHSLMFIDVPGRFIPTKHYTNEDGIGAHISIIYEDENVFDHDSQILELGQEYTFTIKELSTIRLNRDNKRTKLWMIDVDAPELSQLREKYGLPPLLQGHDFHITLGTQVAEDFYDDIHEIDPADAA